MVEKLFSNLIGQERVKKRLTFYCNAYKKTRRIPALLFVAAKGTGKTTFATEFSNNLVYRGEKKRFAEINCSSIKDLDYFIENVYANYLLNSNTSILLDEAHNLPEDVTNAFLSILNVENFKNSKKEFIYQGAKIVFDFNKINFIFATTESNKLFTPFKDRLTLIDFDSYTTEELCKILIKNIDKVNFEKDILNKLALTIRNNPRNAIQRANEIELFCQFKGVHKFSSKSYEDFLDNLGILPYGISNSELQILKLLNQKPMSLNALSASTGLSRGAIQRDHEMFLLGRGLMEVDGKRKITLQGRQILDEIKEYIK